MLKKIEESLQHYLVIAFSVGGMALALVSNDAFAIEQYNISIPASACQPITPDSHLIQMTNSAWSFRSGQTGQAILYCPLPLRSGDLTGTSITIDNIRIFYRDTDASGTQANISVRLIHRRTDQGGIFLTGSAWSSNIGSNTGYNAAFHNINRLLSTNVIYSFRVVMERVNASEDPVFGGIDLKIPPF